MKKFLVAIVALVVLSVVCVSAQTKVDVVYLKNGEILKGRIVKDVPLDYLELQIKDGTIKKVFYQDMQKREVIEEPDSSLNFNNDVYIQNKANEYPKKGSFGLGFGIPFGIIGVNAELMFNDIFAVTAGFGYAIYTYGACAGGRLYLTPRKSNFRPMLNLYYGTNALAMSNSYVIKSAGFNAGAGFKWMFGKKKRSGVGIELIYMLTSSLLDRGYAMADDERLKVSLGYRIGF